MSNIYTYNGSPWCKFPGNSSRENDVTKDGSPWCVVGVGTSPDLGNIKAILKVTTPNILKFIGVPMSNIKQTP